MLAKGNSGIGMTLANNSEYDDLAALIVAIGTPDYPARLDQWMRAQVPFDLISIVIYHGSDQPLHFYDDFSAEARKGLTLYVAQTFLLNPFFQKHLHGLSDGVYRLRDLAPDEYLESELYRSYEIMITEKEELGFITTHWPRGLEEIDIAVRLSPYETVELAIYRSHHSAPFDDATVEKLRAMLPVTTSSFRQHWQACKPRYENTPKSNWAEEAFATFGSENLTAREREVVALVLRGHSSESIAVHLDIARATVKTHRKNAYEKFAISTQAELLSLFIAHVSSYMPSSYTPSG